MQIIPTDLPDVLIIEPKVFEDSRGFFFETYHAQRYREAGLPVNFVQDNLSFSQRGTLRGLHYQNPQAQGKLVQVLAALPRLSLAAPPPTRYRAIRAARQADQVSTLEATVHALAMLEGPSFDPAPLLDTFGRFVAGVAARQRPAASSGGG